MTTLTNPPATPVPTKSVTKQLCINRLNSPEDLQSLIKDFCFYDTKSWETMQFIKSKKNRIHHLLNTACFSRANPEDLFPFGPDTDEHWCFYVYDEDDGENPQFQAMNCSLCGEYKTVTNVPENIQCRCIDHNMTINDFDFDDDETDDDDDSNYIPEGYSIDPDYDYEYNSSDDESFDD
jgi:hypothetical protein